MKAIEFEAELENGKIKVPAEYLKDLQKKISRYHFD